MTPWLIKVVPKDPTWAPEADQRPAWQSPLKEPSHRFVGRSRELLTLERLLAREPYVVIVGEGGEGKTALACELARWLVMTNRAQRAVFVSLEIAGFWKTVLHTLSAQLLPDSISQAVMEPEEAIRRLEQALSEKKTVLVIDNCESVLPSLFQSERAFPQEPELLTQILALLERLRRVGETRLVFTSRVALPAPFEHHGVAIGRLDKESAIELVGRVLTEEGLRPGDDGHNQDDVSALVTAVGCHARSLVSLAREVAQSGVKVTTTHLSELMASLDAKYPDDRERSLYASVELSLRRLPIPTRAQIAPLGIFQGGGHFAQLARVLEIESDAGLQIARQLVDVGLAQDRGDGYLSFHPAVSRGIARRGQT